MMEYYTVVISGRTRSGRPLEQVRDSVGQAFRLQGAQLDRMLSGQAVVVARNADEQAARKILDRLHAADLEAILQPVQPDTAPTAMARDEAKRVPTRPEAADKELFALAPPGSVATAMPPSPAAVPATAPPNGTTPRQAAAEAPVSGLALADEGTVCPKCGEQQPKRTLCRQCGLDMPRYRASQEEAEREAREERAAMAEANRAARSGPLGATVSDPSERRPGLIGLGFSGRLGRVDYFSGMIVSTLLMVVFMLLAVALGKGTVAAFGVVLSTIYSLRCLSLRLQDVGKSGWLCLLVFVPLINALMTLALLFLPGEHEDNDYGAAPEEPGFARPVLLAIVLGVLLTFMARDMGRSPEQALKYVQVLGPKEGVSFADEAAGDIKNPVFAEVRVQRPVSGRQLEIAYFGKMVDESDCQRYADKIKSDLVSHCTECTARHACKAELSPRYAMLFDDTPSNITYLSMSKGSPMEREGRIVFWGLSVAESNEVCDTLKDTLRKSQSGPLRCVRARQS